MTPFVRSTAFVVSRISLPMTSHLRSTPTPSSSRVYASVKRDAALRRVSSRSRSRARSPASFVSMRPRGCGGCVRLLPSVGAARRTHATRASSLAASAVDGNTDLVVDRRRRIARRREPTTRVVAVSVRVRVRIGEPRSKRRARVWIRSAVFNDDDDDWERDGER